MRDPWFLVALLLAGLLATWLGIAGPIVDSITKGTPSDWLGFAGNMLAAVCTLAAAVIAWRAVQPQLAELQKQSTQKQYEQLRGRARELEDERILIFEITSAVDIMGRQLLDARTTLQINGHPLPPAVAGLVDFQRNQVSAAVDTLRKTLGPPWGTLTIQRARIELLDAAYRYSNHLGPLATAIASFALLTPQNIDEAAVPMAEYHRTLFDRGAAIHAAIEAEARRIGARIAELEGSVFLLSIVLSQAQVRATEWFGFTLGMSQSDAMALADRYGYSLRPTTPGSFFNFSGSGPDYLSFCRGRLFAVGRTFDGSFPAFVGMAKENSARFGEATVSIDQRYVTPPSQAPSQMSEMKLEWDVSAEHFIAGLSMMTIGSGLRISQSYSAWKYFCQN